jgi:hypothetical protein
VHVCRSLPSHLTAAVRVACIARRAPDPSKHVKNTFPQPRLQLYISESRRASSAEHVCRSRPSHLIAVRGVNVSSIMLRAPALSRQVKHIWPCCERPPYILSSRKELCAVHVYWSGPSHLVQLVSAIIHGECCMHRAEGARPLETCEKWRPLQMSQASCSRRAVWSRRQVSVVALNVKYQTTFHHPARRRAQCMSIGRSSVQLASPADV